MRLRSRFLQAFGRVAIPNITLYLIAFQVMCYLMIKGNPGGHFEDKMSFDPGLAVHGEWWRAVTFLFMPPASDPVWAFVAWYFFWFTGSALEANWGTVRYNLYLLVAALSTIAAGFAAYYLGVLVLGGAPDVRGTNVFIAETVFLAFATLYPELLIYVMFIIPVRAKWLAIATAGLMAAQLVLVGWIERAMLLAGVANYLLFFREEIVALAMRGKSRARQRLRQSKMYVAPTGDALHRCVICGATEKSHPDYEFRYCSECGGKCYCLTHLREHQHQR